MGNFSELIRMLMSFFVEAGGQGVGRGGKGALLAGFRKIGWAKGGGGGGRGRLGGHRLGGHRMGAGAGGGPAAAARYKKAQKQQSRPAHLHGRASFSGTGSISGNPNNRWVRNQRSSRSYTPRPRGFIKF